MATEDLYNEIPHHGAIHAAVELAAARAAPIFQLMGWHWATKDRPPSSAEIENTLIRLVNSAYDQEGPLGVSGTGRLCVQRNGYDFSINLELAESGDFAEHE